jgi:hypothetical protein
MYFNSHQHRSSLAHAFICFNELLSPQRFTDFPSKEQFNCYAKGGNEELRVRSLISLLTTGAVNDQMAVLKKT